MMKPKESASEIIDRLSQAECEEEAKKDLTFSHLSVRESYEMKHKIQ